MNLEEKILNKIKDENLKPKSIWYFLVKDYSLWGLVTLSIVLGALSIAPIIFILSNLELDYVKHITPNLATFIFNFLPYPFIIFCILSGYAAKFTWGNTKSGYKFQGKYVLIISSLISLILGIILNLYNFGKEIDEGAGNNSFGIYKNMDAKREENWFSPESGRIIGIVSAISTTTFTLNNHKNNFTEEVNFDETVPGQEFVLENTKVRVIGFENSDKTFFACAIFPDRPPQIDNIKKRDGMKGKIKQRFETNPECQEVFEKGRANFHPKPRQNP